MVIDFPKEKDRDKDINKEEIINQMENTIKSGKSLKETSKHFAKEYALSSREIYNLYTKSRGISWNTPTIIFNTR